MFFSNSLQRRRDDIDLDEYRRHWLAPHGPMTAKLPGTRSYVQNHVVFTLGTNALARRLGIDGVPQLGYDTLKARHAAYDSPELHACNQDSPLFLGAVSRVVTECTDTPPADEEKLSKALVMVPQPSEPKQTAESVLKILGGVERHVAHRIIEQAGPPKSKVRFLGIEINLLLELWFKNDSALVKCCEENEKRGNNIAMFHVKTYRFV